jgi:hypothetical protein
VAIELAVGCKASPCRRRIAGPDCEAPLEAD